MNKFNNILMVGFEQSDLGRSEWDKLKSISYSLKLLPAQSNKIDEFLANCDCLCVKLGATVDIQMIDRAPMLKYIGMLGTGYGRIDTKYAAKKDVTVCNIAGYSTEAVAELAFGVLIEHIRQIEKEKNRARKGDFTEPKVERSEIKGKKFGIIGLGKIGKRIAEIAKFGFDAEVIYWSKHRKKDAEKQGIKFSKIEDLLQGSDFISLNLRYFSETENFLNDMMMRQIKKGAIVINLAPMELVDIDAMEKRLKKDNITFILDHADELSPKDVKRLSKYANCIMYPPIGYVTKEATAAKMEIFVDNIKNYLNGKPTNKVN